MSFYYEDGRVRRSVRIATSEARNRGVEDSDGIPSDSSDGTNDSNFVPINSNTDPMDFEDDEEYGGDDRQRDFWRLHGRSELNNEIRMMQREIIESFNGNERAIIDHVSHLKRCSEDGLYGEQIFDAIEDDNDFLMFLFRTCWKLIQFFPDCLDNHQFVYFLDEMVGEDVIEEFMESTRGGQVVRY